MKLATLGTLGRAVRRWDRRLHERAAAIATAAGTGTTANSPWTTDEVILVALVKGLEEMERRYCGAANERKQDAPNKQN